MFVQILIAFIFISMFQKDIFNSLRVMVEYLRLYYTNFINYLFKINFEIPCDMTVVFDGFFLSVSLYQRTRWRNYLYNIRMSDLLQNKLQYKTTTDNFTFHLTLTCWWRFNFNQSELVYDTYLENSSVIFMFFNN